MKLIDANIVIYWVGMEHDYREASIEVMERVLRGEIVATVDVETLQEVLYYFHKRRQEDLVFDVVDTLLDILPAPYSIDNATLASALRLLAAYPSLQTRDAFHAATVLQHKLEGIISADRGFDIIEGLKRFDPKELAA